MTHLYLQLLSIGLLWVMFHCSGMCGPIVAGMVTYEVHDPSKSSAWSKIARRVRAVLAYQGGRAVTYGLMGAMLGGAGASIQESTRQVTRLAGLVAAVIMIALSLHHLWRLRQGQDAHASQGLSAKWGQALGQLVRRTQRKLPRSGPWRMMLYGAILGLMPCMLMFWAMNLAISSASMLHGAGLMIGLVVLTTPTLVGAACLTAIRRPAWRRFGEYVAPLALLCSGTWVGLMSIAANGWIEHLHWQFKIGATPYTIMFF